MFIEGPLQYQSLLQISPEEIRGHPLFKDGALDSLAGSSFNTFYPSLAKLMNGDTVDRNKVIIQIILNL